jgi:Predicted nucleotide-binding protein containing TIR-like domain
MATDIFAELNNAVLDLQNTDRQGFQTPLARLARLLDHEELTEVSENLTNGVDLDAFLVESEATQGSFVGSARLVWPDDARKILALQLLLVRKVSNDPQFALTHGRMFFSGTSSQVISAIHGMTRQLITPFVRDYKTYVLAQGNVEVKIIRDLSKKVFIVHGHDGEARETVARFLANIHLEPIILHEQANLGRTVIEKVEANSDVGFAVVLLTPDDLGRAKNEAELEPRARQNVLLELGYFIAKLGRENVCALKRGEVLIPSDFAGVVWTEMDPAGAWKTSLGRELQAAGHQINWNKVMK